MLRLRKELGLKGKLQLVLEVSFCGRQDLTFYTLDLSKMARGPALSHGTEEALRWVSEDCCRALVLRLTLFPKCLREPWSNWARKIYHDLRDRDLKDLVTRLLRWGCGCGE